MATAPAGIFDPLAKIIRIAVPSKDKRALIYIHTALNDLKLKLEEIDRRLKERDSELLTNAVKALRDNDRERASIYAAEIVEVRKLMKLVQVALLAVERLLERLKTMHIVNDMKVLQTTIGVLNQLKQMFTSTMPELASSLDTIVTNVNAIVAETQTPEINANVAVVTKEVQDILKEVELQAEEKIRQNLSPIPVQLEDLVEKQHSQSIATTQSIIDDLTKVPAMPTAYTPRSQYLQRFFDNDIEMQVYLQIVNNNGVLNVRKCAIKLGVPEEEIRAVLKRLESKGLIKVVA